MIVDNNNNNNNKYSVVIIGLIELWRNWRIVNLINDWKKYHWSEHEETALEEQSNKVEETPKMDYRIE